jgi:hypothetical protein
VKTHTCMVGPTSACADCRVCEPLRLTHLVPVTGGPRRIVRCTHCDGPEAHQTIKKEAA